MRLTRLSCLLLSAALLAGCKTQTPPPDPTPTAPSPDRVAALRASIQKQSPGAQVGQVIATYAAANLAAVADIPVQDFKVGQVLTFVDIDGKPINNGTIVRVESDSLHVKYDPAGKRAPQKGDLAIWLKE